MQASVSLSECPAFSGSRTGVVNNRPQPVGGRLHFVREGENTFIRGEIRLNADRSGIS